MLVLLACIRITQEDSEIVKNIPLKRAKSVVEQFAPLVSKRYTDMLTEYGTANLYGVPLQKFSQDYINDNIKPVYERLAKQYPFDPASVPQDKNIFLEQVKYINSLRNRAELEVRYNGHLENIEQLREQGNKLVIASSHADCSERCRPWQNRVYSLDKTTGIAPDGRKYVPIEEATDIYYTTKAGKVWKNGLLGFNCFSADTEIYTSEGWKLFDELNGNELVYTLNPNTRTVEWQKPTNYYKALYNGEMVHFKGFTLDMLVTPNHNMLYFTQKNKTLRFKEAKDCTSATFFTATQEWQGQDLKTIRLGGIDVNADLYCKFMAFWLADGCVHSETAVKIAQQNNEHMYSELLALPFKVWRDKEKIIINGKALTEELKHYGKCTTKYVPKVIKTLSKRQINLFLDAYLSTDGYIAKESQINGHKRRPHKQLFTTSKQMADDLSELALKAGYRPKIETRKDKGKSITYKNGTYTTNNDLFVIHLNYNVNVTKYTKEMQKYNGYVYCVQVPNHTLLVKRKGTIIWSGNCRHYLVPYKDNYKFPKPNVREERRQYAITEHQRHLERNVRKWRTKAIYEKGTNQKAYEYAKKKAEMWNKQYIRFSKENGRAYYPSRTKVL